MSGLSGMTVAEVSNGFDDLPSMRAEWEQIFLARDHEPSVSFEWTAAMVRHHVRAADQGFLIRLRRGSLLVGIVPLVLRSVPLRGRSVGLLAPLSEEYNTHSDLLLRDLNTDTMSAFLSAIWSIQSRWDCFRMARLLDAGATAQSLLAALRDGRRLHLTRNGLAAYHLPLPKSYGDYLAQRSAKFRNHLKRTARKLHSAGTVTIHELSDGDRLDEAFDAILHVERSSWKETHGSSMTADERQTGFYRELCDNARQYGRLHLQWMTIDSRPAAYNLGYILRDSYRY